MLTLKDIADARRSRIAGVDPTINRYGPIAIKYRVSTCRKQQKGAGR
jgi:hypothetical protein